jgi:hypothetical protein
LKQPKKLTRAQKTIIDKKAHYDWTEWMLLSEDKETFTIIHKSDKDRVETFSY